MDSGSRMHTCACLARALRQSKTCYGIASHRMALQQLSGRTRKLALRAFHRAALQIDGPEVALEGAAVKRDPRRAEGDDRRELVLCVVLFGAVRAVGVVDARICKPRLVLAAVLAGVRQCAVRSTFAEPALLW